MWCICTTNVVYTTENPLAFRQGSRQYRIPLYLEKWSAIALQAKDINHDKAANSVRQAYHFLHLPEPPICYSSQPNQSLSIFLQHKFIERKEYHLGSRIELQLPRKQEVQLKHQLGTELARTLTDGLLHRLSGFIREQIGSRLGTQLWQDIENPLRPRIHPSYPLRLRNCIKCREWVCYACKFDFCITELGASHDPELWEIAQSLVANCDWFVPFTKVCLIGDRHASY
jgi:hypothetical protein